MDKLDNLTWTKPNQQAGTELCTQGGMAKCITYTFNVSDVIIDNNYHKDDLT
ncbi:MAG: hypothetical protein ACYSW7_04135 [Planctomycetota bacterium]